MGPYILAWDLGTGGNKASLYGVEGKCLASTFVPYETHYPAPGWHEQRPEDWWRAVVEGTRQLLRQAQVDPAGIACCGISGHSLGAVPLDRQGRLLRANTPIWSDTRAGAQAERTFQRVAEAEWYRTTGNGFPPPLYTAFKIMWYRDREPDLYRRIDKVVGTKDYINYRLTGRLATDPSYASGSGVYDLLAQDYAPALLQATGLPREMLPDIVPSSEVIGTLCPGAAEALGLPRTVQVVAGGVDNSCMALGRATRQRDASTMRSALPAGSPSLLGGHCSRSAFARTSLHTSSRGCIRARSRSFRRGPAFAGCATSCAATWSQRPSSRAPTPTRP